MSRRALLVLAVLFSVPACTSTCSGDRTTGGSAAGEDAPAFQTSWDGGGGARHLRVPHLRRREAGVDAQWPGAAGDTDAGID